MSTPVKLAQLTALPAILIAIALAKAPAHGPLPAIGGARKTTPETFFAGGALPAISVGAPASVSSETGAGWFQVTVVAELPDEAAAKKSAEALADLVLASSKHYAENETTRAVFLDEKSAAPLTPAEVAAFGHRGIASEIGIGCLPERGPFVLGRFVLLAGLKGDFAGLRKNPASALLAADGGRVFVEGDPAGGTSPAVDLVLEAPDEASAKALGVAFESYLEAGPSLNALLRPPWHPAGLSPAEAGARATFVAIEKAQRRAFMDPRTMRELQERTVWSRDRDDIRRAAGEFLRDQALAAIDAVAKQGGTDPEVVAEMRKAAVEGGPDRMAWGVSPVLEERLVPRLGAMSLEPSVRNEKPQPSARELAHASRGRVHVDGKRVWLGGLVFQRIGTGLPELLRFLSERKCSDVRMALTDRAKDARSQRPELPELEDD